VRERAECDRDGNRGAGQPVMLAPVAAAAAGRRSSAEHAAEHGTRFDDLRVFRSLPTLPRRFSEAEITPPSSLG